jgi:hypothetical protein
MEPVYLLEQMLIQAYPTVVNALEVKGVIRSIQVYTNPSAFIGKPNQRLLVSQARLSLKQILSSTKLSLSCDKSFLIRHSIGGFMLFSLPLVTQFLYTIGREPSERELGHERTIFR